MPVGLELLGSTLSDARLVALAYAYEQAMQPRRPPPLTPPLEGGAAPPPLRWEVRATSAELVPSGDGDATLQARFRYDRTRGTLAYEVEAAAVPAEQVHAIALHRGAAGERGAVIERLAGPGAAAASGTLELTAAEREALLDSAIYLQLYTRDRPAGAARAQLRVPE